MWYGNIVGAGPRARPAPVPAPVVRPTPRAGPAQLWDSNIVGAGPRADPPPVPAPVVRPITVPAPPAPRTQNILAHPQPAPYSCENVKKIYIRHLDSADRTEYTGFMQKSQEGEPQAGKR